MWRGLLTAALLVAPAAAHAEWYEASTEHFVVYADGDPEKLKSYATDLERFDKALHVMRGIPDPGLGKAGRVIVFALPSGKALEALYGKSYNPFLANGSYEWKDGRGYAFTLLAPDPANPFSNPRQALQQSYGYHFLATAFPGTALPAWLMQGYAEFHSTAKVTPEGAVELGHVPAMRAGGGMMMGPAMKPAKVEQVLQAADPGKLGPQTEPVFARGWQLTHYLTFDKARALQLLQYMDALNKGVAPGQAAAVFGDAETLDKDLATYMKGKLSAVRVAASEIVIKPTEVRKLSAGEAATIQVRMRAARLNDPATAAKLATEARAAAAPFAGDAAAQATLATAELGAGNLAEAESAADRAIAADAGNVDALLVKARADMGAAVRSGDMTPATWDKIRAPLVAANRADPNDARVLFSYFQSYALPKQPLKQSAVDGLWRALELAPEDYEIRAALARQFLAANNGAEARKMLAPIAWQPRGGFSSMAARDVIATIDSAGPAAALAKLDAPFGAPKPMASK